MRLIKPAIITLALLSALPNITFAAEKAAASTATAKKLGEAVTFDVGHRYSIHSDILGEERKLLIHLPQGYKTSDNTYPVIYLLDGSSHFQHASTAADMLQDNNMMPASIIVGIPNNPGTRNRDLGDGSDNFWAFIKQEVSPYISKNYQTSGHKTLFGHSFAGAFVLDGFLDNSGWFDSYIAASPGIGKRAAARFSQYFAEQKTFATMSNKSLYFSEGSVAAESQATLDAAKHLGTLLEQHAPKSLTWFYQPLPQHAHMTTPYITLHEGLMQGFRDFQAPALANYQSFVDLGGMKGVAEFYQKRAAKYNTPDDVPENTVINIGMMMLEDGHEKEALKVFKDNNKANPESIRGLNALARFYEQTKDTAKALQYYEQALVWAEKSESGAVGYFKSQIKRLKK